MPSKLYKQRNVFHQGTPHLPSPKATIHLHIRQTEASMGVDLEVNHHTGIFATVAQMNHSLEVTGDIGEGHVSNENMVAHIPEGKHTL